MSLDGPQQLTGYPLRDYDDLIARLGESRRSQGVTHPDLAKRIGSHVSSVWKWLRGETHPAGPSLVALADALGYDLALIPRDRDAPRAPLSEPQGCETGPGVPECTPGRSEAAETRSEPICDCGHDGLDAMWHLRPCPVAQRRAAERQALRDPEQLRADIARWAQEIHTWCYAGLTDDHPNIRRRLNRIALAQHLLDQTQTEERP